MTSFQKMTAAQIRNHLISAIKSEDRSAVAAIKKETKRRIEAHQEAGTASAKLNELAENL